MSVKAIIQDNNLCHLSPSSPPKGTIQGRSKSGADLYMVICDVTEVTGNHFGQLPGFTRDGKNVEACYGGKVKGGYINMIKWLIIHALKNLGLKILR